MSGRGRLETAQFLAICLVCSALACNAPPAGTISLAWERVGLANVTGYEITYRPVEGSESKTQFVKQTEPAKNTVEATITGLESCTEYHIFIRTVDANDRRSPLSAPYGGWARPAVRSVSPTKLSQGSKARLTIKGDNFDEKASLDFVDAGNTLPGFTAVRVESKSGCKKLVFDVAVASDAPTGAFHIDVVNTGRAYGRSEQMVTVNPTTSDQ